MLSSTVAPKWRRHATFPLTRSGQQPPTLAHDRHLAGGGRQSGVISSNLLGDALTNDVDLLNQPEAKRAQTLLEERLRGPERDTKMSDPARR